MAPIRPRPKRQLIGYVLTALVVAHLAALVVFVIWLSAHPHSRQGPPTAGEALVQPPEAMPPRARTASRASQ
jgi:hypothetical protein